MAIEYTLTIATLETIERVRSLVESELLHAKGINDCDVFAELLEARYVRRFRAFVALILALVTVLSEFHLSREGKTVCLAYSSK
jgi:hypothetical protein